jgi:prepilin-type N-terminal cleavage/methylation domain-containing protein
MIEFDSGIRIHSADHPTPVLRPRRAKSAFTLVELALVLVLIAMFSMLAFPRYSNFVSRQRLEAAARRIGTDLAQAQRHAKQSGAPVTVRFEISNSQYRFVGLPDPDHPSREYSVAMNDEPYVATLVSADFGGSTDLIFDAYGTPQQGGSVVVKVGDRQQTVTIDTGDLVVKPRRKGDIVQVQ